MSDLVKFTAKYVMCVCVTKVYESGVSPVLESY